MKATRVLTVFLFLIALAVMINCKNKKKDNNLIGPNGNTNNGSMSATVSGEYNLSLQSSTAAGVTDVSMMSALSDFSQGTTNYSLTIMVYSAVKTGTFDVVFVGGDFTNKATCLFQAQIGNDTASKRSFWGYSGTITISEASNTHLKGTFQFAARENIPGSPEIAVTNGSFDVPAVYAAEN